MTTMSDFDRRAAAWLADGPSELHDRVLEAALREVHLTRQRRRWSAPWRFLNMPMLTRTTASAAALLIAVIGVGGALYLTSNSGGSGGTPTPTPASTPSTTTSPARSPSATAISGFRTFPQAAAPLAAGTYKPGAPFQLPNLTFDVPAGWNAWTGVKTAVISIEIDSPTQAGTTAAFVNFEVPVAVYADPCQTGSTVMVPHLGPTVDDFVAALSTLPKFTVGPVTDAIVDGLPGKQFDLTNAIPPNGTGCTGKNALIHVWGTGDVGGDTLGGLRQHVIVVDVRGTRLVIEVLYTDPSAPVENDINAIIASVRFE
jgi:hypothetical protein